MTEKETEWKRITDFGDGAIFAAGDERKIVTLGSVDFHYQVNLSEITSQIKASIRKQRSSLHSLPASPNLFKSSQE